MLKEYDNDLYLRLNQLACEAHKSDGCSNQDREVCEAIWALCDLYSKKHDSAMKLEYIEFCGRQNEGI